MATRRLTLKQDKPSAIRDRIVGLRRVRAGDLMADPRNWRRHPQSQRDALQRVLTEIGYADALLARETPEGLVLVDGHLRAGLDPNQTVPVLVLDLDEAAAGKLLATLDPLAAFMPKSDSARTTKSSLAASSGATVTLRASLAAASAKILTVFLAVAQLAKGYPIAESKTKGVIGGPRLQVMSMKASACSTMLALIGITLVNRLAPYRQIVAKAGSVPLQRKAVFPRSGFWPYHRGFSAWARAETFAPADDLEGPSTMFTGMIRGTVGPTCLTAPSGIIARWWDAKRLIATLTYLINRHMNIIPQRVEPRYAQVALERWQNYTGKKAQKVA